MDRAFLSRVCQSLICSATVIMGAIMMSFSLSFKKCKNWLCAARDTFKALPPFTPWKRTTSSEFVSIAFFIHSISWSPVSPFTT
jgi:hypothetical protein